MRILVACEESQSVTIELRKLGHEAYSCDIQECSGGYPEWHLMRDVTEVLKESWDMIIAFPPCTDLAVSGAAWFEQKRKDGRQQASIDFFMLFANHPCKKIAIENPVGIMNSKWRKPDQIIQPYEHGHEARKKTCLWLKGLPKLTPTNIVGHGEIDKNGHSYGANSTYARDENGKILSWKDPRTAKARSKTFPGIAKAMAMQWAGKCE
jgi:site-specific DNA-cytosine methylase